MPPSSLPLEITVDSHAAVLAAEILSKEEDEGLSYQDGVSEFRSSDSVCILLGLAWRDRRQAVMRVPERG